MDSFEKYLQELAGNVQNYDTTETYAPLTLEESYDATNIENYLKTSKRIAPGTAKQMSVKIVRNPIAKMEVQESMRRDGVAAGFAPAGGGLGRRASAAIFDLKIQRKSTNIDATLPVPIFGPLDLASKYRSVLVLPSGVSLVGVDVGKIAGGEAKAIFTYRDSDATPHEDTIEVSISQYEYPSFLEALKSSNFMATQARIEISAPTDPTGLSQLTQKFQSINRSMFGKKVEDDIPLSGAKTPYQQQNGIVDINGQFEITAQVTWVLDVPKTTQLTTINMNVAVANKGLMA